MSKFCSPDVGPSTGPWRLHLVPSVFSFSRITLFENREAPGDAVGCHLDLLPKELSDLATCRFFLSIISTTDINYRQCYRQTSSKFGQLSLIRKNRPFQLSQFRPRDFRQGIFEYDVKD